MQEIYIKNTETTFHRLRSDLCGWASCSVAGESCVCNLLLCSEELLLHGHSGNSDGGESCRSPPCLHRVSTMSPLWSPPCLHRVSTVVSTVSPPCLHRGLHRVSTVSPPCLHRVSPVSPPWSPPCLHHVSTQLQRSGLMSQQPTSWLEMFALNNWRDAKQHE